MKTYKLIGMWAMTVLVVVLLFGFVKAYEQSHPLSQIHPIDVNLNMYGFNVTNTSYVGIGTVVPEYPLDVYGSGRFTGNLYVSGMIYGSLNGEIVAGGNLNMMGYDIFNATNVNTTNLYASLIVAYGDNKRLAVYSNSLGGIAGSFEYDPSTGTLLFRSPYGKPFRFNQALWSFSHFPLSNNTYDLGSSSDMWANVYAVNGYFTNIQTENINGGSPVTGSGSTNYIPIWTSSSSLGNSVIYQNGSNVGIGTTSPSAKLDVAREDNTIELGCSGSNCWTNANGIIGFRGYGVNHGQIAYYPSVGAGGSFAFIESSAGDPASDYGPLSFDQSFCDIWANQGIFKDNVGIGTTTPQNKLTVIGDINATGYVYGSTGLCIGTDCKTSWSQVGGGGVGPWDNSTTQIFVRAGYPLFINASNTLFINGTSSNVGIGTTSPVEKLEVNGAIKIGDTGSACDASHRGVMKFVTSGSGEDDKLYICMKNSTDSYIWVLVARGG